jgi:hypothetical protein
MSFPGSDRLLRHAGRRVVRELGISDSVGSALGLTSAEDQEREKTGTPRPVPRRPLHAIDRAAERAIGERAFQAALAHLGGAGLSPQAESSLAQAIAHAVVEALDEYAHRAAPPAPAPPVESGEPQTAEARDDPS